MAQRVLSEGMNHIRLALCVPLLLFSPIGEAAVALSSWKSTRVEAEAVIDGILDDAIWIGVPSVHQFRQVEPVAGGEPSVRTDVFLAYDAERLYFAVVAYDHNPSAIIATQRKRDADLKGDDTITLVLDPFLDKRNGYYFAFNALGARQDALIRGGVTLNTDWDGLWDVATTTTEYGWIAEGYIPLSTLSFNSQAPAWGVNLERSIARTGERMRWHGTERQYEVNNLANAGLLTGLTDLQRDSGLELRPFVTVTYANDRISVEDG